MSSRTLYLRPKEQPLFAKLSDALRDGWKVTADMLETDDRPEELAMRYQIARFENPALKKAMEKAAKAKTPEEFTYAASLIDVTALHQEEAAELFFALGTKIMSKIILHLLSEAKSDEDLEGIAGLTEIRHMLLETNSEIS